MGAYIAYLQSLVLILSFHWQHLLLGSLLPAAKPIFVFIPGDHTADVLSGYAVTKYLHTTILVYSYSESRQANINDVPISRFIIHW